jgi:hypothetical protein
MFLERFIVRQRSLEVDLVVVVFVFLEGEVFVQLGDFQLE